MIEVFIGPGHRAVDQSIARLNPNGATDNTGRTSLHFAGGRNEHIAEASVLHPDTDTNADADDEERPTPCRLLFT